MEIAYVQNAKFGNALNFSKGGLRGIAVAGRKVYSYFEKIAK